MPAKGTKVVKRRAKRRRTDYRKEADRALMSRMYLQGKTIVAIATELKLAPRTVTTEMQRIRERWMKSSLQNFDHLKSEQLAKIDTLEAEYWDAWKRSVGTKEESTTGRKQGVAASGEPVDLTQAKINRWTDAGDPRFLDGVGKCIQRRCEILGFNAPVKIAPTDPTGEEPYSGLSDSDLLAIVLKVVPPERLNAISVNATPVAEQQGDEESNQ